MKLLLNEIIFSQRTFPTTDKHFHTIHYKVFDKECSEEESLVKSASDKQRERERSFGKNFFSR